MARPWTTGVRPEVQARRRASPAEMVWSVSRPAVLRWPRRVSMSIRTVTWVVEVVGGQVLEELGEGEASCVGGVGAVALERVGLARCRTARLRAGRARAWVSAAGCGHGVDERAQDVGLEVGQGEVAGGGAVAVVVEGEPRAGIGGVFLGGDLVVLVGVDDGGVGFDLGEDPAGVAAELGRVEAAGVGDQTGLAAGALLGGDPGGQLGEGVGDDAGVGRGQGAVGEGVAGLVEGGSVGGAGRRGREGGCQGGVAGGLGSAAAGVLRDPVGGGGLPGALRDAGGVGGGDEREA